MRDKRRNGVRNSTVSTPIVITNPLAFTGFSLLALMAPSSVKHLSLYEILAACAAVKSNRLTQGHMGKAKELLLLAWFLLQHTRWTSK